MAEYCPGREAAVNPDHLRIALWVDYKIGSVYAMSKIKEMEEKGELERA